MYIRFVQRKVQTLFLWMCLFKSLTSHLECSVGKIELDLIKGKEMPVIFGVNM
jgi:hypothetical protein